MSEVQAARERRAKTMQVVQRWRFGEARAKGEAATGEVLRSLSKSPTESLTDAVTGVQWPAELTSALGGLIRATSRRFAQARGRQVVNSEDIQRVVQTIVGAWLRSPECTWAQARWLGDRRLSRSRLYQLGNAPGALCSSPYLVTW